MDLDQYREMKAQEQKQEEGNPNAQAQYTTANSLEEFMEATGAYQNTPEPPAQQVETQEVVSDLEAGDPQPPEQTIAESITIDGKTYSVEDLQKQLAEANQAKEASQRLYKEAQDNKLALEYYNAMMSDPEYAKAFAQDRGLQYLDPKDKAVQELEQNYNALLLQREIEMLESQHSDFNAQDVVQFALDRNIPSLRDAYTLQKATVNQSSQPNTLDADALREQIKQELLAEMKVEQSDTSSLVGAQGGGAKPVNNQAPQLSAMELRIAQEFGMTASDYAKYK